MIKATQDKTLTRDTADGWEGVALVYPDNTVRPVVFVYEAEGGLVAVHPGYDDVLDRSTAIRPLQGDIAFNGDRYQITLEESGDVLQFRPLDDLDPDPAAILASDQVMTWVFKLRQPIADERARVFSEYLLD